MEHRILPALVAAFLCTVFVAGCVSPLADNTPVTREIHMWVEQMEWEIHPGVTTTVWAYCAEGDGVEPVWDGPCGVPGPTVRVNSGDRIILTFENTHAIPHTVHFHGWHPFEADMNGNPLFGDAMTADPGETEVIEWIAEPRGSFIYHCHFDTPMHMEMGMYGAFIVEDPERPVADVDQVMILDEWQIRDPEDIAYHGNLPAYNYFTINGRSFPTTQPIVADPDDLVRLHIVNAGYEFHALHVHGYTPMAWEGVAGPEAGFLTDVKEIAPGQTVVMEFPADREGAWLFHDHVVPRVTAASDGDGFGVYPRGMLTVLLVGETYLEAVAGALPGLIEAARGDSAGTSSGHGGADHDAAAAEEPADQVSEPEESADAGEVRLSPMKDFVFEPTIEIAAGTTVTWENEDSVFHTVTADDGSFDSGNINAGESWSYTFTEPGTYKYYCKPHAYQQDGEWKGMVATVVVT